MATQGKAYTKFIDEVKDITRIAVAAKQKEAELNYPKIKDLIMTAAKRGESECRVSTSQMNEYDKKLLTSEGFNVSLVDRIRNKYADIQSISAQRGEYNLDKEWLIRW